MENRVVIRKEPFRGWDAISLSNELIRLTAVPSIGGRIMAYVLGPHNYLYIDPNLAGKLFTAEEHTGDGSMPNWKNYGGDKTWPSPQGWSGPHEWPGPPDAILDAGHYQVTALQEEADGSAVIEMTSPADGERTGIKIARRFQVLPGTTRIVQTITFHNISDRPVSWSIWDVNQMNGERRGADGRMEIESTCTVTTRVNPNSRFPRGYQVMFGDPNNPQWQVEPQKGLFTGRYQYYIGKVGLDASCGWVGFSNTALGFAMAENFPYEEGAVYPDGGASVEFWTVGRGKVAGLDYENSGIYLMEIEVLSPKYTLQPGESKSFVIQWGACRLDGDVVDSAPGGLTAQPLTLQSLENGYLRLTGKFGTFDTGTLYLSLKDHQGQVQAEYPLGPASPLDAILLDKVFQSPRELAEIRLEVRSSQDGIRRQISAMGTKIKYKEAA